MGDYYGGGGSGGGGGFVNNSQEYSNSPGGSGSKKISTSLRPVTIRQIVNASQAHTDAEFMIDGSEPTQLKFVAQVISCQAQATNIVLIVTDGSGQIEVRQWLDSSEDGERKTENIGDMVWVRILGTIKSFHDKKHVTAARIAPITDMHEIYHHQLEALKVHLWHVKGPLTGAGKPTGAGVPSAYSAAGSSTAAVAADPLADLPPIQRSIIQWMKNSAPGEEGLHVVQIAQGVAKNGHDATAISTAIDELLDNGYIYSTIDDEHYTIS